MGTRCGGETGRDLIDNTRHGANWVDFYQLTNKGLFPVEECDRKEPLPIGHMFPGATIGAAEGTDSSCKL